jgi:hypothetical protein
VVYVACEEVRNGRLCTIFEERALCLSVDESLKQSGCRLSIICRFVFKIALRLLADQGTVCHVGFRI